MFYSERHGGYFLIINDQMHPHQKIHNVYFTPNLESWNRPSSFIGMWDGYLVELPDGTLVLIFSKIPRDEEGKRLPESMYVSTSSDGDCWTTLIKVEQIMVEEPIVEALESERANVAGVISITVTILIIIAAVKIPYFGFNI